MEGEGFDGKCWIIFIYTIANTNTKRIQWDILEMKRGTWRKRWILGGDFNEILSQDDKQ